MLTEFQELIDTAPVVRMYINQMIAQVSATKPYRKRHLEGVTHMMGLIHEVLTMAPESGGPHGGHTARRDPGLDDGVAGQLRRLPRPAGQRDDQEDPQHLV